VPLCFEKGVCSSLNGDEMDRKALLNILLAVGGAAAVWWIIQQAQKKPATVVPTNTQIKPTITTPTAPAPQTDKLTQIATITNAANKIACIFATGGAAKRCAGN